MPYLLWILLYWILEKIIIPKGQNISFTTIFLDIIGIPFCTAPVYAPLWFVRDLYLVTFFLPLIKRLTMHTTLSIASCALLWLTPLPNELQQVFTWYVFGVLLFNRKESFKSLYTVACEKIKNFNIILITIGIIGNVVISVYPIDLVMRILKAFWVLTVLSVFMRQPHTYQQCGKFENVGSRLFSHIFHASFSIYVLHGKILSVSQIVFAKFLGNSAIVLIWGYFALPIIIIIICLVLDSVLKKTPAYNLLTGSRK